MDTLTANDLNTDGCVELARVVLKEAYTDLTAAVQAYAAVPDMVNKRALELAKHFYLTEFFAVLSGGAVGGRTAISIISRMALRGRKVAIG